MKRILLITMLAIMTIVANAQGQHGNGKFHKFNPQKFEERLEQFVIKEAGITQAELPKFLKVYREKRKKEVAVIEAVRKNRSGKPTTEKEWAERLKEHDNMEIQLKKIQQTYHNEMLKVIPASKVVKLVHAEDQFHRDALRNFQNRKEKGGNRPHNDR